MKAALPFAVLVHTMSTLRLCAHSDPRGDVHPRVVVENGNFAIYFQNNLRDDAGEDYLGRKAHFRVVFSPAGELLAPRHAVPELPRLPTHAPGVYGTTLSVGNERLIFLRELLGAKPSYLLEVNGRRSRRRLAWPEEVALTFVHDMHARERALLFAAHVPEETLALFHFNRDGFAPPTSIKLGRVETIYDFPCASNVIFAADRYWIGWMREVTEHEKTETVLSSWRPGEKEAVHQTLTPSSWNSDLALAEHEGRLCLAYHCMVAPDFKSRIITHFRDAR